MASPIVASPPRLHDHPRATLLLSIVGRLAICYLFVLAALYHLTVGWDVTLKQMIARGVPLPSVFNVLAMLISGGLALALLFNIKCRWAALGLALYTLCVSWVMYGPFQENWPSTQIYFMKDMAIFGALLSWSCALAPISISSASGRRRGWIISR